MAWNPGLTQLRDLLADLYPTIQLSREVLEQAGFPTGHVEFSTAATSNWHQILKEADRRRKVPTLIAVARLEFPERDAELMAAEQEYLRYAGPPAGPLQGVEGPETPATSPQHSATMPAATGVATGIEYAGTSEGAAPDLLDQEPDLGAIRDLLLAAFTPADLVRLFRYTSNAALRPVVNQFGPGDGLSTLADKALTYCEKRGLLPDLLEEVKRENPRQYARFEPLLWGGQAGTAKPPNVSGA